MSRLIVKNLPKIKEERLRSIFGTVGTLTDCSLKYTKDGVFRKFAFIGYSKESEALEAIEKFNKTFIDTSKIQVEQAKDFSDASKPRAWSRYSMESSAFQKKNKDTEQQIIDSKTKDKTKKDKKKSREKFVDEMLGELKDDPKFDEFLEAHKRSGNKNIWDNDGTRLTEKLESQGDSDNESDGEESTEAITDIKEIEVEEAEETEKGDKIAMKKNVTDLDYLKSKVSSKDLLEDTDSELEEKNEVESLKQKKSHNKNKEKHTAPNPKQKYMLKMKNVPITIGERAIRDFFNPIKPTEVRIPKNDKKKAIGVAYVDFSSEKDLDDAMRRNKNFIRAKRVYLKKCEKVEETECAKETVSYRQQRQEEMSEMQESVAETGRLFVRNLPYSCTQEDLEELFGKFGPIVEVHLSIDTVTRKIRGYAFVLFMMPEHAVKAYEQLDGTVFMGRMLHVMPAHEQREDTLEHSEGSSYKTKKKAKQKAEASSSHNWNTLFLGSSAVADVMATKYNTEKSQILDPEASQSLGVRMALGETQIVAETRDFLTENGVMLDSFSQPAAPRSKTVILVKNLPAGTDPEDLRIVFAKHGSLGRVVLPPSGITAIVEYLDPTEAKLGFRSLAYTKHVPLYLEWAPMEIFRALPKESSEDFTEDRTDDTKSETKNENDASSEEEEHSEPDATLFVKNLNFSSTEDSLREKFKKCGEIRSVSIAKKKDLKNAGQFLSMGYGFVEFKRKESAMKALKELQHSDLDGHSLELKISNRTTVQTKVNIKKEQKIKKQTTTKILVRNIPFEANKKEIYELFKYFSSTREASRAYVIPFLSLLQLLLKQKEDFHETYPEFSWGSYPVFGELKFVRLPKKLSGTGKHRGFGFVDFMTRQDAKRAFEALCHSTHLYGRRLVLEWAENAEDLDELRKKTAEQYHDDVPSKKLKKSAIIDELQSSVNI